MSSSISADVIRAIETELIKRGWNGRLVGREAKFCCHQPDHDDRRASASWNTEKHTYYCQVCKAGGGAYELARDLGIELPERPGWRRPQVVASFIYRDADGAPVYAVDRFEPSLDGLSSKDFRQRRAGQPAGFVPDAVGKLRLTHYGLKQHGIEPILYRLNELPPAGSGKVVFIVEGERKVDQLRYWGHHATCNTGGAKNWQPRYSQRLAGLLLIILPDNDDAGLGHLNVVAAGLAPLAASVRVLRLPGLPTKGDVLDWVAGGGTADQFSDLIDTATPWTPPPTAPEARIAELGRYVAQLEQQLADAGNCPAQLAERDRQIETMTNDMIAQDRYIARMERQRAAQKQGMQALAAENRALLMLAHHPRTSNAVGAVWELSKRIRRAPDVQQRIVLKDVARAGASSPPTVGRLVADLEATKALDVRRESIPARAGQPKRDEVYLRLPQAGFHVETRTLTTAETAMALVLALPNTKRASPAGNTHGGKRTAWCSCCKQQTTHRVERRRIERCVACETVLDDTLTVQDIDTAGDVTTVYYGAPAGFHLESKIRTEPGFQDETRPPTPTPTLTPVQPLRRVVDDTWPAPMCDAPNCEASATATSLGKDYCAAHAPDVGGELAAGGD